MADSLCFADSLACAGGKTKRGKGQEESSFFEKKKQKNVCDLEPAARTAGSNG
jgi:hypothetical protein